MSAPIANPTVTSILQSNSRNLQGPSNTVNVQQPILFQTDRPSTCNAPSTELAIRSLMNSTGIEHVAVPRNIKISSPEKIQYMNMDGSVKEVTPEELGTMHDFTYSDATYVPKPLLTEYEKLSIQPYMEYLNMPSEEAVLHRLQNPLSSELFVVRNLGEPIGLGLQAAADIQPGVLFAYSGVIETNNSVENDNYAVGLLPELNVSGKNIGNVASRAMNYLPMSTEYAFEQTLAVVHKQYDGYSHGLTYEKKIDFTNEEAVLDSRLIKQNGEPFMVNGGFIINIKDSSGSVYYMKNLGNKYVKIYINPQYSNKPPTEIANMLKKGQHHEIFINKTNYEIFTVDFYRKRPRLLLDYFAKAMGGDTYENLSLENKLQYDGLAGVNFKNPEIIKNIARANVLVVPMRIRGGYISVAYNPQTISKDSVMGWCYGSGYWNSRARSPLFFSNVDGRIILPSEYSLDEKLIESKYSPRSLYNEGIASYKKFLEYSKSPQTLNVAKTHIANAIGCLLQAIINYKSDLKSIMLCYSSLSTCYLKNDNVVMAFRTCEEAISICVNVNSSEKTLENLRTKYAKCMDLFPQMITDLSLHETIYKRGLDLYKKGNYQAAIYVMTHLENNSSLLPSQTKERQSFRAACNSTLASCYRELKNYESALDCMNQAIELRKASGGSVEADMKKLNTILEKRNK